MSSMAVDHEPRQVSGDAERMLSGAELVLLDLDGCLAFGEVPHPAAAQLIERLEGRYVIVSNNSTDTPQTMAASLHQAGLTLDPQRIILAGALMIDELAADEAVGPVCLFAGPRLVEYARERGLSLASSGQDVSEAHVAIARDTSLTYNDLNLVLERLFKGAPLIVSNPDLTHPGRNQIPVIETGAILAIFKACLPSLQARIVGKPEPLIFETALRRFGVAPGRALMIGDNPHTDGAGADRVGMPSILVGPLGRFQSVAALI